MRLALALAALPVVLFAYAAWSRAIRMMRQDAKESKALTLADNDPQFARAYSLVRDLGAKLPSNAPWTRPEHGQRAVYILRGGRA